MNSKLLIQSILFFTVPFFVCNIFSEAQDPLGRINYQTTFDQKEIHKKFAPLMHEWGCTQNVFGPDVTLNQASVDTQEKVTISNGSTEEFKKQYTQACLAKLRKDQRWAITEGAREAVSYLALETCALTALHYLVPKESLGGSFGTFVFVSNMAYTLKPLIQSGYNLAYPPSNALDALEKQFAQTQCFIPKVLWPVIIGKFTTARSNQFEQKNATDFLEFVLDLTTYKPKPVLSIDEQKLEQGMQEIFAKIDHFFDDYEKQPVENLWKLKNNVSKFIHTLISGDHLKAPRYIHLHGLGGIGKTYFVNQLAGWIEEFIPGSVRYENMIISGADELEGNAQRPGALLRVLRNQLRENKRGSIVFMDEASWLNSPGMVCMAKRVFNGDQTKLSTSYFGNGVEGAGIDLAIPPLFIFVASNEQITDPALKNRFDTIEFPAPKKETLIRYARAIAEQNELIKRIRGTLSTFDFEAWLVRENVQNFRDAASQIVPAILSFQQ